jgi:acyl-CoA synthetase (AMP-forming)/AMP-acid ligase II/acyl carrier protein
MDSKLAGRGDRSEESITGLLQGWAERAPGRAAISAPGRRSLTYGDLYAQVENTVKRLNQLGVGRNDRVAMVLHNGPEMAVAFLAVSSGATCAPLNPDYGVREFEFYLSDLNPRALILQSGLDSPATGVAEKHGIPIIELGAVPQAEAGLFTLAGEERALVCEGGMAQAGEVALVLHTSGTTARPKIVPLRHTNLCASAFNIKAAYELAPDDCCLNVMPLFHIHGLVAAVLSTVAAGASVACTPGFEASRFFGWLEAFCPSWYTAVPTMHMAVLGQAASDTSISSRGSLRFIRSCSAALPPQVMAALEDTFGVPVLEAYGMTEAAHQMTSNPLPPSQRKPRSVGIPTGPQVAIMDGDGRLLTTGETGEILIHGVNVFMGYESNPEANKAAFVDGWFRTGDQGFLDGDGYLFITGRMKEIINRGGEKVAPREIDEMLLEHPAVAQAATFAVPHSTLGEDVAAAVVLHPHCRATERELRDLAFARLAEHKVPSQIVIVDTIPKGPTGKVQRIGLAEALAPTLKAEYVAPTTALEAALARIWAEVLGLEEVGIHDNFFRLGGNSLLAAQVISQLRETRGVRMALSALFAMPTVAGLAATVEQAENDNVGSLHAEKRDDLQNALRRLGYF